MSRKPRQPTLWRGDRELERATLPSNVQVVETEGKTIEQTVEQMLKVPLEKSMLLDFLIGYEARSDHGRPNTHLNEDQRELYRLQMLLNSRYHSERFNFLGDDPIALMVRKSINEELWKPKFTESKGETKP